MRDRFKVLISRSGQQNLLFFQRTIGFCFVGIFIGLTLPSCASFPPPQFEYAMAREAYEAARSVEAARHSPGYFHQGEDKYRQAQQAFERESYKEAQRLFQSARQDFERAENSARWMRFKSGDIL